MFFLRKKRLKRDREAGLVFQWRGSKKHHLGKFVALMVAASCFVFASYAVRIEGPKQAVASKRTGTLILLNEDDPNCRRLMLQVEERSPFPSRWDPAHDAATRGRLAGLAEGAMGKVWQYLPELSAVPPHVEESSALATVVEEDAGLVADLMPAWRQKLETRDFPAAGDLYVRGSVTAGGGLAGRLARKQWALPANLVTEDWFGQSFRFMLGVDADGIVRSCVPLPGGTMEVVRATDRQRDLAVWLRTRRFKPAKGRGMAFGELKIQIEATRE